MKDLQKELPQDCQRALMFVRADSAVRGEVGVATINDLIEHLIYFGDLEPPDVRARARYLREAGILPASAKGKTSQVESVHAVALLLACVGHEHQTHAPDTVRGLWTIELSAVAPRGRDQAGNSVTSPFESRPGEVQQFGTEVLSCVEYAAGKDEYTRGISQSPCDEVQVLRGGQFATILYKNRIANFGAEPGMRLGKPSGVKQIKVTASVPWDVLQSLGFLVSESRTSLQRGFTIETASAWRGLGLEPPILPKAQPMRPQPSMPARPSGNGPVGNETAATPGREAAAARDQPAQTELDGGSQPHPTSERDKSQSPPAAQTDRSPSVDVE